MLGLLTSLPPPLPNFKGQRVARNKAQKEESKGVVGDCTFLTGRREHKLTAENSLKLCPLVLLVKVA